MEAVRLTRAHGCWACYQRGQRRATGHCHEDITLAWQPATCARVSDSKAEAIMDVNNNNRSKRGGWARVDRVARSIHLYTGLFLVPWMLVYAASAFLLNHGPALREWLDIKPPRLEIVREVDFVPDGAFPATTATPPSSLIP